MAECKRSSDRRSGARAGRGARAWGADVRDDLEAMSAEQQDTNLLRVRVVKISPELRIGDGAMSDRRDRRSANPVRKGRPADRPQCRRPTTCLEDVRCEPGRGLDKGRAPRPRDLPLDRHQTQRDHRRQDRRRQELLFARYHDWSTILRSPAPVVHTRRCSPRPYRGPRARRFPAVPDEGQRAARPLRRGAALEWWPATTRRPTTCDNLLGARHRQASASFHRRELVPELSTAISLARRTRRPRLSSNG